jgi:hypothetical protein
VAPLRGRCGRRGSDAQRPRWMGCSSSAAQALCRLPSGRPASTGQATSGSRAGGHHAASAAPSPGLGAVCTPQWRRRCRGWLRHATSMTSAAHGQRRLGAFPHFRAGWTGTSGVTDAHSGRSACGVVLRAAAGPALPLQVVQGEVLQLVPAMLLQVLPLPLGLAGHTVAARWGPGERRPTGAAGPCRWGSGRRGLHRRSLYPTRRAVISQ